MKVIDKEYTAQQAANELNVIKHVFSQEPAGGLLLNVETQRGVLEILARVESVLILVG